jgi:hypothetical protein
VAKRVTEVEVQHRPRPRRRGSSYSATGLVRLFMDFFVNAIGDVFAWMFLIGAGLAALFVAFAVLAALAGVVSGGAFPGWLTALFVLSLAFQAAMLALFGLAGDYIQRIYRQSSGRPFYLVRRVHETESAP